MNHQTQSQRWIAQSRQQPHALQAQPRRDSRFQLRTMMGFVAIVACLLGGLRAAGLSAAAIAGGVIAVPLACGMTIALIELMRGIPRQSD